MIANSTATDTPNMAAYSSVKRKLVVRNILLGRTDAVARAAHGVNERGLETAVDLAAQTADMRLHYIGLRVEMEVPHRFQQHGAGHDLSGMTHQILQQPELPRLQIDTLT